MRTTREKGDEEMPAMVFASPVLRGEEEEWRRFAQELEGSRRHEYEGFRRRLGIRAEQVWLERTRGERSP